MHLCEQTIFGNIVQGIDAAGTKLGFLTPAAPALNSLEALNKQTEELNRQLKVPEPEVNPTPLHFLPLLV
jgi:hypothetical protein